MYRALLSLRPVARPAAHAALATTARSASVRATPAVLQLPCARSRMRVTTSVRSFSSDADKPPEQPLSAITNTPLVALYHPTPTKVMPMLLSENDPNGVLRVFQEEVDKYGSTALYGWLTAKETINRIAKLATKNPRNRASLKTDDTRLLTLLSIPEEALKQKAMSSRGRTGYNTDDLTSIVASLKALRMQNHSLYATLQDTLAEEKRELEETSEPGGSNEKARFR